MTFEELGNIFKQEREKRGLSIKEVMEVTKISRRNIIALEEGNSVDLPHPVYAKGFIRSYARFLGLDGEELARVFDSEVEADGEEFEIRQYDVTPGTDLAFQEADSRPSGKKSSLPAVLLIILLLGILGGLVYYFGFHAKAPVAVETSAVEPDARETVQTSEAPLGASGPAEEVVQADDLALNQAVEESTMAAPAEAETGQQEATEPEQDEGTAEEATSPDAPPVEVASGEAAAPEPSRQVEEERGDYRHVLVIRATTDEGCWVGVWKDESQNLARDFFLRKGEPLRLKFNSFRRIRIGNVPGVTISYNGEGYPMDVSKGKTQDLRFGQ